MNRSIYLDQQGLVHLHQDQYIGSGGQADVYVLGDQAIKLFHDMGAVPPPAKVDALQQIGDARILVPHGWARDKAQTQTIGYTMAYAHDSDPIVKYFSPGHQQRRGVQQSHLIAWTNQVRADLERIHGAGCLAVDLNEMNLLIGSDLQTLYWIDTDSFQAGGYGPTAISDAILDPLVNNGHFSVESDWFAAAVILFQLWIGIHPYKGGHPQYAANAWRARMRDGQSALAKGVSLPPACRELDTLPTDLRQWFDQVFTHAQRVPPPGLQTLAPSVVVARKTVTRDSEQQFERVERHRFSSDIRHVHDLNGDLVVQTNAGVYLNGRCVVAKGHDQADCWLDRAPDGTLTLFVLRDGRLRITTLDGALVDDRAADAADWQRGLVVLSAGQLSRVRLAKTRAGIQALYVPLAKVMRASAHMMPGAVYHQPLGKPWVTLFLGGERVIARPLPELAGWRVIAGRAAGTKLAIHAEKGGCYRRFLCQFEGTAHQPCVRQTDAPFSPVNLAVTQDGVCAYLNPAGQFELFRNIQAPQCHQTSPLTENEHLCVLNGRMYVWGADRLERLRMRTPAVSVS